MNERLDELKKLWNKNFDGELTPAESARLAELMADEHLMEAFSADMAERASSEAPAFSDEQWKAVDAKILGAYRRHKSGVWLRPLAMVLASALVVAGGAWWFNSESSEARPALGVESEEFKVQDKEAAPQEAPKNYEGSHEVHSAKISVVVEQPKQGQAAVRILSASGALVRSLYAGDLKPGKYRFEWNGLDGYGTKVKPGAYTIEIKSAKGIEKRELEIRAKK